jgi:phosphatidylglycerophosphatase A
MVQMINAQKSFKEKTAILLGTVFGIGYTPKAPGTAASLFAAIIYFFIKPDSTFLAILCIIIFVIGIFITPALENIAGKDPSLLVIDELAGQWVAFLFVNQVSIIAILTGFILFRLFDILKPLGINKLQDLHGGWGVMLDDILAGLYSAIIMYFLISLEVLS